MTTVTKCSIEQAYLLKGRLEEESIPAYVSDENASTAIPLDGTPMHTVRVQVADVHFARAHAIVLEIQNYTPERDTPNEPFVPEAQPVLNALQNIEIIGFILFVAGLLYSYFHS